jgi:hypothetical protein
MSFGKTTPILRIFDVEIGVKGGFVQLNHGKKPRCRSFLPAMA